MMKTLFRLLLFLPLFFVTSNCGNSQEDAGSAALTIELIPNKAIIVPAEQRSCRDFATGSTTGSIGKHSVSFNQFKLSWADTNKILFLSYMRFKFTNPKMNSGQEVVVDIAGDEMDYLVGKFGSQIPVATSTTTPTSLDSLSNTKTYGPACSLRIGGLNIEEGSTFTANGTLTVYGYTIDPTNGNAQDVVKKSIQVSIEAKN